MGMIERIGVCYVGAQYAGSSTLPHHVQIDTCNLVRCAYILIARQAPEMEVAKRIRIALMYGFLFAGMTEKLAKFYHNRVPAGKTTGNQADLITH